MNTTTADELLGDSRRQRRLLEALDHEPQPAEKHQPRLPAPAPATLVGALDSVGTNIVAKVDGPPVYRDGRAS